MVRRSILHLRLTGPDAHGICECPEEGNSRLLADFCRRTSPAWELSPDGAYLDLTGTERLYGRGIDGAALIGGLARSSGRIRAVGAAPTRFAARLASWSAARAGGGILAIRSAHVAVFLEPFSVKFLPGARPLIHRFGQLGVRTCGDLQVVPRDLLQSVFGDRGGRLADEAWGRDTTQHGPGRIGTGGNRSSLELVVGARLARPASADYVVSALRRGLAVRALTLCQGGPASRGRWRLTATWPEGRTGSSWLRGPDHQGWKSWLALLEHLWGRLPVRRKGLLGLELAAELPGSVPPSQGHLFPDDAADCRLADVMRRCGRWPGARVNPACEEILAGRGVTWYGPGEAMSKPGQGFG